MQHMIAAREFPRLQSIDVLEVGIVTLRGSPYERCLWLLNCFRWHGPGSSAAVIKSVLRSLPAARASHGRRSHRLLELILCVWDVAKSSPMTGRTCARSIPNPAA